MIEFGGQKIGNFHDIYNTLHAHADGDTVTVTVMRGQEKVTKEVTLERRK